jgi:hypothetical protein
MKRDSGVQKSGIEIGFHLIAAPRAAYVVNPTSPEDLFLL